MLTITNRIFFIERHQIPVGCKVSYVCLISTICTTKYEFNSVRLIFGGDHLDYPGITTTQCTSLTTTKYLLNINLSTKDAKFMVLDIKNLLRNSDGTLQVHEPPPLFKYLTKSPHNTIYINLFMMDMFTLRPEKEFLD